MYCYFGSIFFVQKVSFKGKVSVALFGSVAQSRHVHCFKKQQCLQRSHLLDA